MVITFLPSFVLGCYAFCLAFDRFISIAALQHPRPVASIIWQMFPFSVSHPGCSQALSCSLGHFELFAADPSPTEFGQSRSQLKISLPNVL